MDVVNLDELASKVATNLKADVMAQLLNDPIVARAGVVTPDGGAKDKEVKNFADYLAAVIRSDTKRLESVYEVKAQVESSATSAGYMIPPQYASEIQGIAVEESIIRGGATVLNPTAPEWKAPRMDQTIAPDGSSAFLGGVKLYWTAEAGNIQSTSVKFDQIDLKAHKLAAYMQVTSEVLQDAPALSGMLTRQFGLAKAWFEDYHFLQGNGVGKPLGILNAPATYSVTRQTSTDFTLQDATNMLARLPASSKRRAVWIIHQSVEPKLMAMATSGNFVTFLPNLQNEPVMRLLGREVMFTEKIPELGTAGDVLLVDRSNYYIMDRQGTTVSTSDAPGFLTDETTIRMTSRLDGQPALNDKITLASGTYQVSPYVKLS
jgi:HK97 family phage major capsid protein